MNKQIINLNKWDVFYLDEQYIYPNSKTTSTKQRPCIVLQSIGSNIIAIEITSSEGKYHLPLITKIGNLNDSWAKMSYIFTFDFFKLNSNIKKLNLRLEDEDRNKIKELIDLSSLGNVKESEKQNMNNSIQNKTTTGELKEGIERQIKNAKLVNTSFKDEDLSKIFIKNSDIKNSNFNGTKMIDSLIKATQLKESTFIGADLTGSIIKSSDFRGSDFSKANLTNVTFVSCDFTQSNFIGTIFNNTTFKTCKLTNSKLDETAIAKMNLITSKVK